MDTIPEIVNIVGSGRVDSEIDLRALADDLDLETVYIKGPGLYFKHDEQGPTIIVARSGKYIITGAKSKDRLAEAREQTLQLFSKIGLIEKPIDIEFSIKNMVLTADLDRNVDLSHIMTILGFECTEYEPEQFPGLVYRPDTRDCVVLIFATGKVVITGARELEMAEKTFEELRETLSKYI